MDDWSWSEGCCLDFCPVLRHFTKESTELTGLHWAEGFWGGWWFSASLF